MSSFYTYDFMYDDVPSQKFDLKIINFQDGGLFDGVGSSDVNILSQRVLRKSKPYYLGRTQEPVLEFPLTFGTSRVISGFDRDVISAWLFGRSSYKKLYILQDDLNGAYFNCFLREPKPLYIGNMNYAFTCTVVCDSPWAYLPERIISGSTPDMGETIETTTVYNNSSEDEYLYPTVSFSTPTYSPGAIDRYSFLIRNSVEWDRAFYFFDLYPSTTVTVNNDLQIVEITQLPIFSSWTTEPMDLTNFNKNWFRLVPKINYLQIYCVTSANTYASVPYEIRFTERVKIGG